MLSDASVFVSFSTSFQVVLLIRLKTPKTNYSSPFHIMIDIDLFTVHPQYLSITDKSINFRTKVQDCLQFGPQLETPLPTTFTNVFKHVIKSELQPLY